MIKLDRWKLRPGGNITLNGKGFYISFRNGMKPPPATLECFRSDNGAHETALVRGEQFYILNGDFRQDYEKLVDIGWKVCKDFFDKNKEKASSWSD